MTRRPGERAYPRLFSPFRLGPLALPNRFVVPGLTTNYASADGFVTDALCTYLAARARGGFGLIVTENLGVHSGGRVMPRMAMIDDDRCVPGLARLAAAVKRHGAAVIGQLSHAGRQTKSAITGLPLVAPSAIACPINRELPRALEVDEIQALEQGFVRAAVRLRAAGFDGVEIHGAHGYLVGEFLSRYSNTREDLYGGPLENRLRFLSNIVDGIRVAAGGDFPLIVRISAREFVPDGLDLPESIEIVRRLAARGVHALSVSVGVYESFNRLSMVSGEPEGPWLPLAGALRSATGLPTIGVGRLKRAAVAEAALASGAIDLAAFGRASIADPDLPRKVRDGREPRVLACLGCNVCLGRTARPETTCPVNPTVGREAAFDPVPPAHPLSGGPRHGPPRPPGARKRPGKAVALLDAAICSRALRLAIRGSSLSALTAAWIAARRGHRVTLYEPAAVFGGLQGLRARVPGQEEIAETVTALLRRAEEAGVTLVREEPEAGDDDMLWGVRRFVPVGTGLSGDRASAASSYDVLASADGIDPGSRAVVIGDDLASGDAALVLAARGVVVELRSPAHDVAVDAHPGYRELIRRNLERLGAAVVTGVGAELPPESAEDTLVVRGRDPRLTSDDDAAWEMPRLPYATRGWLDDAYEPGRMTRTVYDAVAHAMRLDGS